MGLLDLFKKNKAGKKEVKTYNREFKVAGVTFLNSDGTPRQDILKAIYENERPFHKRLDVAIKPYKLKSKDDLAVIVNRQIIGNIAKEDLPFFESSENRIIGISNIDVGESHKGYYAKIKVTAEAEDE